MLSKISHDHARRMNWNGKIMLRSNSVSMVSILPWARIFHIFPQLFGVALAIATLGFSAQAAPASGDFYISPDGSNGNNGLTPATPWKTFAKAFSTMAGGKTLVLLDGIYGETAGTGYISYLGAQSAQPPSGISVGQPTRIIAQHEGKVTINGSLFIGRSTRKDQNIWVQDITFEGGGSVYNGDYCTIKNCGFHGAFGLGTNDHAQGCQYNLIEDVWVWAAQERIIAINYRAHKNVWRRVVIRGDGCGTADGTGSGNPNVGFTVYDSSDCLVENVLLVDRILLPSDSPYADFAVAQHTPDPQWYFGRNKWLGCVSLNAPDAGFEMEPDAGQIVSPAVTMRDCVAWNSAGGGFNFARDDSNNDFEGLTARVLAGDAIRVAPEMNSGMMHDVVALGNGRYALNSAYAIRNADISGSWSQGSFNQTTPTGTVLTTNPLSNGAIKYPIRIETGGNLHGAGTSGRDIGANVLFRYGADGSRFGDAAVETLTTVSLWPWPNEDRIKREMSVGPGNARGFCATGTRLNGADPLTLTSYLWEAAGQVMPADIYNPVMIAPSNAIITITITPP